MNKHEQHLPKTNSVAINDLLVCFFLSILAIGLNAFGNIALYGSIALYFGSIAALLSILILPLRLSILVLLASLGSFYLQLADFYFVVVQAVEYFFVLTLIRLKINFLVAVFSYWLLIGLPSVLGNLHLLGDQNLGSSLFTGITIGLNGFVCGIFALFAYWFVPTVSQFKRFNPKPPRFSNVVFELCIVSVILPTILITFVFTWQSTNETEKRISQELVSASWQFDEIITDRLEHNLQTVASVAEVIQSLQSLDDKNALLNAVANSNDDIESMAVTDNEGGVNLVAPENYAAIFSTLDNLDISERNYFKQAKKTQKPFISRVLEGRGLGSLDIVSIAAPIMFEGEFTGIVQAATKLERLVNFEAISRLEDAGIEVIVTDNVNAIVYSSLNLELDRKSFFDVNRSFNPFLRNTPVLDISGTPFMYANSENSIGWNIYTLAPPSKVFTSIVSYFLYIGLTLLVLIILIGVMANRLATKITRPLVNLEGFLERKLSVEKLLPESTISREMQAVTESLITAREVSEHFQENLKQEVEDKTRALEALNLKLLESSQRDALTKLYNRGAFDQLALIAYENFVAQSNPCAILLADIDFFKKVNDSYGHQAGDYCIIDVAVALQEMCRPDRDIVARYGGEEFIILLDCSDREDALTFVESIRQRIEAGHVEFNEHSISFTMSCGLVIVQDNFSLSLDRLVAIADEQLYNSKRNGRNQTTVTRL